jgi:hypothetical protein
MDSFEELPTHYLRIPAEAIEFAFFCRQSELIEDKENGGLIPPEKRRHTDGWNEMRRDLGGMPAFRSGVEAVHRLGRKITLYVDGLIVPEESELFGHIPAAATDRGRPTARRTVTAGTACHVPGRKGGQDHLASMCARLMRESESASAWTPDYYFGHHNAGHATALRSASTVAQAVPKVSGHPA